jgi:Cof subfamily protein (haloacid dehalogenase superfamily)
LSGQFKALAIDLDGTLLLPTGEVSERSHRALVAASAAGIHVIIASARWSASAERVARVIPGTKLVIACSGAQVRRLQDNRDLVDLRLPGAFAQAAMEICDNLGGTATWVFDETVMVRMDEPRLPNPASPEMDFVHNLQGAAGRPVRMAMIPDGPAAEKIRTQLRDAWAGDVEIVEALTSSGRILVVITAKGGNKGAALQAACEELGITPAEVVAFGDSGNDLPMFAVAGAAVAMANGTQEAKAAATFETLSNVDDGIAEVVERLLATGRLG